MTKVSKEEKKKILTKPIGLPKTGGRKAGTPNKKSVWLREELENAGINWGEQLKEALSSLDYKKAEILISLLPYLNPKMKEVDIAVSNEESIPESEEPSLLEIIK